MAIPAPVNHNLFPLLHSASFLLTSFFSLHKNEILLRVEKSLNVGNPQDDYQGMHHSTHSKHTSMHPGAPAGRSTPNAFAIAFRPCMTLQHTLKRSFMPAPC